jgi:inner membrane protein
VQAAIGIALGYIALNLLISQQAGAAVRGWAGDRRVEALFASPPPLLFWRRDLAWREDGCYRHGRFDPLDGRIQRVSGCAPANLDHPLVRQALRNDPRLRKFLKWSILPIAVVERGRCVARVTVGDARYNDPRARARLMRQSLVPTASPGCQATKRSQ